MHGIELPPGSRRLRPWPSTSTLVAAAGRRQGRALVLLGALSLAPPAAAQDIGETLGFAKEFFGDEIIPEGLEDLVEENPSEALVLLVMRETRGKDPFETLGDTQLGIDPLRSIIFEAADKYALSPALIDAVIRTESGYRPQAVSRAGARGLMQLMPETANEMGVQNVFAPRDNIFGGARYLRKLLDQFKSLRLAIAAYNAGPGVVRRHGGIPPYPETRLYVATVLRRIVSSALARASDEVEVKRETDEIRGAGEGVHDSPRPKNQERSAEFDQIIR